MPHCICQARCSSSHSPPVVAAAAAAACHSLLHLQLVGLDGHDLHDPDYADQGLDDPDHGDCGQDEELATLGSS